MRQYSKILLTALSAASLASLATLIANSLFYRVLSDADATAYGVFVSWVQLITLIASLGQAGLITRIYNLHPFNHFNWRADLQVSLLWSLPGTLLLSLLAYLLNGFSAPAIMLLMLCGIFGIATLHLSNIQSTHRHFVTATFWVRFANSLLVIPALLAVLIPNSLSLLGLLSLQSIAMGFTTWLAWRYSVQHVQPGTQQVRPRQRRYGIVMMLSITSTIVPDQILIALGGALLLESDMAAWLGLSTLFRPIQLLNHVVSTILITEVTRRDRLPHRLIMLAVCVLVLLMLVSSLLILPPLSSWLYDGRYDFAHGILFWIALANVLDFAEIVPRAFVSGRLPERILNQFFAIQVLIGIVGGILGTALMANNGLLGACIGVALIFVMRLAVSLLMYVRYRHSPLLMRVQASA